MPFAVTKNERILLALVTVLLAAGLWLLAR
jgi:hypothetical protein